MAKFYFNGADSRAASLGELASLSDEEKYTLLRPAAEIFLQAQTDKIKTVYSVITGALSSSLRITEKSGESGPFLLIDAKGKHPGTGMGKRFKMENGKRRSAGNYQGTNAEVLYFLEYGTARIPASHAIEIATEEAEPEAAAAMEQAWDELLKSKGL